MRVRQTGRRAMRALAGTLLLVVAACASPNPDIYTLAAMPGPAVKIHAHSIELRRVGLAGYLDRPEIVRSNAQFRLQISGNERWGEPMGGMIDRVFTEDLVERLPNASVFVESGAISTRPDVVLEVDVQRFDPDAGGNVVLLAQVAIRHEDTNAPAVASEVRLTTTPASKTTPDLVAAMSLALGQLADEVAERLGR